MKYIALYKVEYYGDGVDNQAIADCGLLYAESFTDATAQIEKFYGTDLAGIHFLELYDVSVFTFSPIMLETIKKTIEENF